MAVQTSAARPAGKSVGAGIVSLLVTLVVFVVALLAFLLAPLALLGVALVGYLVMRPRGGRTPASVPGAASGASRHVFGAGTR
jgi:hypothetical protein